METLLSLGIIFGSTTIVVAIIAFTVIQLVEQKSGRAHWGAEPDQAEETRLSQKIHEGFCKMDARVEALETIILGRESKENEKEACT